MQNSPEANIIDFFEFKIIKEMKTLLEFVEKTPNVSAEFLAERYEYIAGLIPQSRLTEELKIEVFNKLEELKVINEMLLQLNNKELVE